MKNTDLKLVQNYLTQGLSRVQKGDFTQAKILFQQALRIQPNSFDALNCLGYVSALTNNYLVAVEIFGKAIAINPNHSGSHCNYGNALKEIKRFDEALESYNQAIKLQPDYPEAFFNRGIALDELKRFDEALESYEQAINLKVDFADAYVNRGNTLKELNRFDEALERYDQAIEIQPCYPEAYFNRGITLGELKRFDEALASYDQAIQLKADYALAHVNRGNALKELSRLPEALASYDKAIELNTNFVEAYINRGITLAELKRLDEAIDCYKSALLLKPNYEFLLGMEIRTNMQICNWEGIKEKIYLYERDILKNIVLIEPFISVTLIDKPELQKMVSQAYAQQILKRKQGLSPVSITEFQGKIRIGYYSADFYNHATSYLIAELFEVHNTRKFELYGFSFGKRPNDEMGERVSVAFDKFFDITSMSDKDVMLLSRQLGIDIAVDLKGYTKDNRVGIFAERCAPIQVSYLGYPGTLGADYIDYVIADKMVLPESSQNDFTEKAVYLPHTYQVNDSKRKISNRVFTREELGLPLSGFVFCCFNNNYKISPSTFDGWMRILKAVDGSVLWLLEDNKSAASNLLKEAQARGVASSRLVFAERKKLDEHLARHQLADLFIDTLPCNAHTTASDALWAGLPVLTCMGRSFASRVAGSLLNAVKLPELITYTQEDYEARAIELATHPYMMEKLRSKLYRNRLMTPLFDSKLYAKHIEAAYEEMFARAQAGLPPEPIEIQQIN